MAQYAYPRSTTTTNTASAYAPTRASTLSRRRALKTYGPPLAGAFILIWFLLWLFSGESSTSLATSSSYGSPSVVIVTTLDPKLSPKYREAIKENRRHYAARHGYATFFPNTTDYDLMEKTPQSWSTVPALRHAMTLYPNAQWLWYLTSSALIMNSHDSLQTTLLHPSKLEPLMIKDQPVVPPDSVIKTFTHLKPDRVDFILTQDREGLAGGSLLIRTGEWAKFFLDAWYDPLYRSYNFQKAEGHALEHIVQWHGTILAKLALVPQRVMNSYTRDVGGGTADGESKCWVEYMNSRIEANDMTLQASIKKAISSPTSTAVIASQHEIVNLRWGR